MKTEQLESMRKCDVLALRARLRQRAAREFWESRKPATNGNYSGGISFGLYLGFRSAADFVDMHSQSYGKAAVDADREWQRRQCKGKEVAA